MAKKNLRQMLAEQLSRTPDEVRAKNFAIFLKFKEDIAAALDEGWPVSKIWKALTENGEIDFSYYVFARYVRKYLRDRSAKLEVEDKVKATDKLQTVTQPAAQSGQAGLSPKPPEKVLPGWPKPGTRPPTPITINKGELPVYGVKSNPDEWDKF